MAENENIRDEKGRIKKGHSLNLKGRPKNSKGSKHKYAKSTLENKLNKMGPEAFDEIMAIGREARASGDIGTALRCFMYVGGKQYEMIVHNDRIEIQELKRIQKEKDSEQEQDDEVFEAPQVSFSFTPVVVNE